MTDQFSTISLQQLCDQENEPRVIIKAESPRFDIVVCNSLFAQVSQTQNRELAGQSMAEIHSWNSKNEDSAIEIYDAIVLAIKTKSVVHLPIVQYDLTGPDGTLIPSWWEAIYQPLLNTENNVEYVLCTTHNITANQQMNQLV